MPNSVQKLTRVAVMLVNTGTPCAPTPAAIRQYLTVFLSDRHIVNLPPLLWKPILHGIILNTRPRKTAKIYQSIWTEQGSPYTIYSQQIESQLQKAFDGENHGLIEHLAEDRPQSCSQNCPGSPIIAMAQRYGSPSIEQTLSNFCQQGIERIVVLPLYPQQAIATTGSVLDELERAQNALGYHPEQKILQNYYDHPLYIEALATQMQPYLKLSQDQDRIRQDQAQAQDRIAQAQDQAHIDQNQNRTGQAHIDQAQNRIGQARDRIGQAHIAQNRIGQAPHVLFSYHSVPLKDLRNGDKYYQQVVATTELLATKLQLPRSSWSMVFQSRFEDAQRWQGPFLPDRLQELFDAGQRNFVVLAPIFAVDCTETLYEIDIKARKDLLNYAKTRGVLAEQLRFHYIPALNAGSAQIELLKTLISQAVLELA